MPSPECRVQFGQEEGRAQRATRVTDIWLSHDQTPGNANPDSKNPKCISMPVTSMQLAQ
ncbi:hypothetical protein BN2475_1310004 [Paraburkholderia ribeironis]|uniref:Uncharacterized protein n=1 Tax=Paraburkholderia ribeironis TaxID=1247936 RepID=A0A1N7SPA2_9BURK|nr:hypothetical protein BN2475_1310004 [Paraburkholderia ribeironis]